MRVYICIWRNVSVWLDRDARGEQARGWVSLPPPFSTSYGWIWSLGCLMHLHQCALLSSDSGSVCVLWCFAVFFLRVRWLFLFSLLISLISVPPLLLCLEFSDLDFVFLFKWEGIGADGCHLLCFCQLLSFVFSLDLSFGSEDL